MSEILVGERRVESISTNLVATPPTAETPPVATAAPAPPVKKTRGKLIFIPFPSGTQKAIVSFSKRTKTATSFNGAELVVVTEPRKVICDTTDRGAPQNHLTTFKRNNCRNCRKLRNDKRYLAELIAQSPEYLDRTVDEILEAFDRRAAQEELCPTVGELLKRKAERCPLNHSLAPFYEKPETAEVDAPALVLRMNIEPYLRNGTDCISMLKKRPNWFLYAYKEVEKREPQITPYRLSNVYGNGGICWGRNGNPTNPKLAMNTYWASGFNFDLRADGGRRNYTYNLKEYLETYEVPQEGYFDLKTIIKKDLVVATSEACSGLLVSSYSNLLKAVPKDKQVAEDTAGEKKVVFAWVTYHPDNYWILNCRGALFKMNQLDGKAKVTPYTQAK